MSSRQSTSEVATMEARIIELEMRVSFQEDTLTQLNDALISQQRQIDQLGAQVRDLREELEARIDAASSDAAERRNPRDEIPPHY